MVHEWLFVCLIRSQKLFSFLQFDRAKRSVELRHLPKRNENCQEEF